MPIYKIGTETFELANPKEAAFIATKMGGVEFKEVAPRVGKLTPTSEEPQSVDTTSTYEYGTPSGRKGRVTTSTVPGSVRPMTPEEDAALFARQAQAEGRDIDLGEALLPRFSSSIRALQADAPNSALPRHAWQIGKDIASIPGRAMDYGIRESQGEVQPGSTWANALGDPTAQTYMPEDAGTATQLLGTVLRDPLTIIGGELGAGIGRMGQAGKFGIGSRIAAGTGLGIVPQAMDRATDYNEETGIMPSASEAAFAAALGAAPEAIAGGLQYAAPLVAQGARDLFMAQVKALPGKNKRQVWEGMRDFAADPDRLREVTTGARDLPEVAQNFAAAEMKRDDAVKGILQRLKDQGIRIPLSGAYESAENAIAEEMRRSPAAATNAEKLAALNELKDLLYQSSPEDFLRISRGEITGAPHVPDWDPFQATSVKSDLYGRIDWKDPGSSAKSIAAKGASAHFRNALNEADELGELAKANPEWGKYLAAKEGFERMESRTTNRDKLAPWRLWARSQKDPRTVTRMLDLSNALETPSWLGMIPRTMAAGQAMNREQ